MGECMSDGLLAAKINVLTAVFNATIEAMVAENKQREHLDQSMAYVSDDFVVIAEKFNSEVGSLAEVVER